MTGVHLWWRWGHHFLKLFWMRVFSILFCWRLNHWHINDFRRNVLHNRYCRLSIHKIYQRAWNYCGQLYDLIIILNTETTVVCMLMFVSGLWEVRACHCVLISWSIIHMSAWNYVWEDGALAIRGSLSTYPTSSERNKQSHHTLAWPEEVFCHLPI